MTSPTIDTVKQVKLGQQFGQAHVTKVTPKKVTVYFPLSGTAHRHPRPQPGTGQGKKATNGKE